MSPTIWQRCPKCAWQPHGLPAHAVAVLHSCPHDGCERSLRRVALNSAAMDPKLPSPPPQPDAPDTSGRQVRRQPRLERTEAAQAAFDASLSRFGL